MEKIAVLGTGAMGAALARCLIGAGHAVCVWNRSAEKAAPLGEIGAQVCATPDAAVAASDLVIVCIKAHRETVGLVEGLTGSLTGKTVCDLSTGDTADADRLVALLTERGAGYMLGMINSYPSGIGDEDVAILTVGGPGTWDRYGAVIRTLGGKSEQIGDQPAALTALFAGLFTTRQAFMFGMIYGALVCRKAGVPMQVYVDQLPVTMKVTRDYYDVFARTVPSGDFENPGASMQVYVAALEDALNTVRSNGAPDDLLRLFLDRTQAACADGLSDKQLTALVAHMAD